MKLNTFGLPWLSLILLLIGAIGILLPIAPNDYWWYVRLGEEVLESGAIPQVDTYTYTQAGQPMVYHSWLSAVAFAVARAAGGEGLTVLTRSLLLMAFYSLIWYSCRLAGAGPKLAAAITLLTALAGSNNWAMRPQLFAFPLFALALAVLWRWQRGDNRLLWLLPLIVLLWVNLHGSFVLIFLLVGAALVGGGGDRRALALAAGSLVLVSLLNPRGLGAWSYVSALLTDPPSQQLGMEWKPPTNQTWQGGLFFGWLLLLIPLASLSPARLKFGQWLWLLGFGWMALSGLRYVVWFLAVLAPLSAVWLTPLIGQRFDRSRAHYPAVDIAFSLIVLLLPLALLPGWRQQWWTAAPPALKHNTPVAATDWLRTQPDLPGPLWGDLAFSSYLIYALPERPVWIDTRFELFPLSQWEDYVTIAAAKSGWETLLAQDAVRLLILDQQEQADLVQALASSVDWTEVYQDDTAIIFIKP